MPIDKTSLQKVRDVIPCFKRPLQENQLGRICVVGGCEEFVGGVYFAGISAKNLGSAKTYVLCSQYAAPALRSYTSNLDVIPELDSSNPVDAFRKLAPNLDSVVFGPGLGINKALHQNTKNLIIEAISLNKPIIVDADAVHIVINSAELIRGYRRCVLTPNNREFRRLYDALIIQNDKNQTQTRATQQGQAGLFDTGYASKSQVEELARELGGVTIISKGPQDIISNGSSTIVCDAPNSNKRCWGQGDILSGSLVTFLHWAVNLQEKTNTTDHEYDGILYAGFAACFLTRLCNIEAFKSHGRSMATKDMEQCIKDVFKRYYGQSASDTL